jgi:hypothetical protein
MRKPVWITDLICRLSRVENRLSNELARDATESEIAAGRLDVSIGRDALLPLGSNAVSERRLYGVLTTAVILDVTDYSAAA